MGERPLSQKQLQQLGERTKADAGAVIGGAEYVQDISESGEVLPPRLEFTASQVHDAHKTKGSQALVKIREEDRGALATVRDSLERMDTAEMHEWERGLIAGLEIDEETKAELMQVNQGRTREWFKPWKLWTAKDYSQPYKVDLMEVLTKQFGSRLIEEYAAKLSASPPSEKDYMRKYFVRTVNSASESINKGIIKNKNEKQAYDEARKKKGKDDPEVKAMPAGDTYDVFLGIRDNAELKEDYKQAQGRFELLGRCIEIIGRGDYSGVVELFDIVHGQEGAPLTQEDLDILNSIVTPHMRKKGDGVHRGNYHKFLIKMLDKDLIQRGVAFVESEGGYRFVKQLQP